MNENNEYTAMASLLGRGTALRAARIAGWSVGLVLAVSATLMWGHGVASTHPLMSLLALASALWLAWIVFDFAMRPLRPPPVVLPPDEVFSDTVASWQLQD